MKTTQLTVLTRATASALSRSPCAGVIMMFVTLHATVRAGDSQADEAGGWVQEVAEELAMELGAVDPFEVGARAGKRPWGYVEVGQALFEVFEEILDPYVEDVRKLKALGYRDAATEACKGILLGLYSTDQEGIVDWLEWSPDLCSEATSTPLLALAGNVRHPGRLGRALPQSMVAFCRERLPEWPWLLD